MLVIIYISTIISDYIIDMLITVKALNYNTGLWEIFK